MKRGCRGMNGETEWVKLHGDVRYAWSIESLFKKITEFAEWFKDYCEYMAIKLLRLLKYEEKMRDIYEKYGVVIVGFSDWLYDVSVVWILRNDKIIDIKWHGYNCKRYIKNGSVVAEECSALGPLDSPIVRARKDVLFYISRSDELLPD